MEQVRAFMTVMGITFIAAGLWPLILGLLLTFPKVRANTDASVAAFGIGLGLGITLAGAILLLLPI